ncbi:phosphoribosylglycinamide formyltransferase [Notoacmeibacter ruber]|uniref:Phosphoribosylglycinamide formyltransferase n=1 Tax=Notoacmeibacter ruber TaxID=2670375 RepID=A0A3L7JAE0_9HYPH|nr:phosphoribosylglycinamide formyltransferase [Notoacmeibacter ruber]RLQ87663.1 phosphoribosylglycinamide formyltransferase [Notoacmeibacter ruber]
MSQDRKRIAILISGRGTNMRALISAALDPAFPARIVGVLSNRPDAAGLATAEDFGIPTHVIPHRDYDSRAEHDAAMSAAIKELDADFVCLAGYMRLLSADFVQKWEGRLLNVHPALLPSFKGINTHARALASGVRVHGATVHFVTEDMDDGPIIAQGAVPVLLHDGEETLSKRVLQMEHHLYPLALRLVAEGKVSMREGYTHFSNLTAEDEAALLASAGEKLGPAEQP